MTYLHMLFMLNVEHVHIKQTIINKDIEAMLCCLIFSIIYICFNKYIVYCL